MRGKRIRDFFRFSFAGKVFTGVFLAMALLVAALDVVFISIQTGLLNESMVARGHATAELLADSLRLPLYSGNTAAIETVAAAALRHKDVVSLDVYSSARVQLVQRRVGGAQDAFSLVVPNDDSFRLAAVDGSAMFVDYPARLVFWAPIRVSAGMSEENAIYEEGRENSASQGYLGYLAVGLSKESLSNGISSLIWMHVRLALLFLAACGAATYFIVRAATRPLNELTARVRRDKPGYKGGGDVELLGETYNRLLVELDDSFKRLSSFNELLEEKVLTRTDSLNRANEALKVEMELRKAAELELQAANEALETRVRERTDELERTYNQLVHSTKLNAMGKMVASIAHELNSPLCGIRMTLDEMALKPEVSEQDRKVAALAVNECKRIEKLVGDLRVYSRPPTQVRAAMNVNEILDAILLLNKRALKKKMVTLELDFCGEIEPVYGDPGQIHQVFLNVFQNALDAISEEEGGFIKITTGIAGREMRVEVADSGAGIAPEDIEKVFEPFFSTKAEVKGTGLGLSISREIVEKHGGVMTVESEFGAGTRVTVILPLGER